MQRIEAADYRDLVRVGDPRVSPDGESVVFVRRVARDEESDESTVYRVPIGGDDPEQFTAAAGEDAEPRFSPDGDRLAFVSDRGDRDRPQVWVMATDGGEARRVTDVAGGASEIAWSPDGSRIAFLQRATPEERNRGLDLDVGAATEDGGDEEDDGGYEREEPDPRVIDRLVYRAGERYFDGTRSHAYLVDPGTGAVERLTDGDRDVVAPAWGDASTLYYAVKGTDDPENASGSDPDDTIEHEIVAHDVATDDAETVTRTSAWTMTLAATADGRVVFPHTPADRGTLAQTELHVYDRADDATVVPTAGLDRTVGADVGLAWGPGGDDLYFATPDEGRVALRRVRGGGEPEGEATPETVLDEGHLDGFAVGSDVVAFTRSEWDHPGDVFVTSRGGAEEHRLTRVNAGYLDDRAVCQPEEVRFESDGREIQGWVLAPPDFDPAGAYPVVVEIHGGPHAMWSTSGTMWHEFQTLAARGYVVFWCNPRGSAGYGEDFMAAIEGNWGEITMRDVLAGAERVLDRDAVDEDDAFVTGGSFGGYMTAWIVGHTDRFRAAAAQRGVYDLIGFYGATDLAFKLVEWDFGTTPLSDPDSLWDHSPVAYAGEVATPTLVLHSEDDFRVPINDAELLFRLLKKAGVETRFVRYPREGHELSRGGEPGHVVDRLERIARWFDGYSDHHDAPPAVERTSGDGLSRPE